MKYITIVRTSYPHWGSHSGIHQFINYLDRSLFRVHEKIVPIGNGKFPIPIVKTFFLYMIRSWRFQAYQLNDLIAESSIFFRSLIKKTDIIHLLDAEHSLMLLPYLANKLHSFPKILAMFHQPPEYIETLVNTDIFKYIDHVLVVSPDQVSYFKQFMPFEKISMILHGIDTAYFKPEKSKKANTKFICLSCGVWLRDYNSFINAARILQNYSEIEFHIISSKFNPPNDLKNLKIHQNISDADLLRLYQTSDVLFMPLQASTANNVILEGIACGLPVISSDLPSVKAYLPNDEALLVKDNKPDKFASIILDLYNNPKKREEMSKSARTRAIELSWSNITKEYEKLYIKLSP